MATSSGADWLDKLIARHSAELDELEDAEVEAILAAYEDGRRALRERLASLEGADRGETWTAQSHRVALLQVEIGVRQLQDRLGRVLAAQERARHEMAVEHLKETLRQAESEFGTSWPNIETRAVRRLAAERELLLYKHSVDRYGADLIDKIQRELVRGRVTQETIPQTTARIVGTDRSVFEGMKGRAELIARMENNRAYGAGHQASLEEAAEIIDGPVDPKTGLRPRAGDDPLMKKASEFRDRRNHPMSRALDGRVAPVNGEWEVPVAEVVAAGAAMNKGVGGIVWPLVDGVYRGAAYPAHFNDRGRQVPWRASWADSTARAKERAAAAKAETAKWREEAKRKADEAKAGRTAGRKAQGAAKGRPDAKSGPHMRTEPSRSPSPDGRPSGVAREVPHTGSTDERRALKRQYTAEEELARLGYAVERLTTEHDKRGVKQPDTAIEGRIFDIYAPSTRSTSTMRTIISDKVRSRQADRFVIALDDSPAKLDDVIRKFRKAHPVAGAVEILALRGGKVHRVI